VSIGDYVLGGGEVASLVMIEAITRLIPGVLGNPDSLAEESHNEEGYLEYPNFTKPQNWRDIAVPEILLSGNHGEIAKWRAAQALERAKENL
jgi:tRNA (guanine37-N1)-methyltransferase